MKPRADMLPFVTTTELTQLVSLHSDNEAHALLRELRRRYWEQPTPPDGNEPAATPDDAAGKEER